MKTLLILFLTTFALSTYGNDQQLQLAKGEWYFQKHCTFCHERKGQGGVGPNLTDNHFIYGPLKQSMEVIVRNGIPSKGMPEWQKILPADQIDAIIEYVWSIRKTNVKGKAPEGIEFKD
jgi:cytochrome c oxidase cbb3-type subunit III